MATQHNILARERAFEAFPSRLSQFSYDDGIPIALEAISGDPQWTLYTIDTDSRRAVLLRMPEGLDLTEAPFSFMRQFTDAEKLALVSYDEFYKLADAVPRPSKFVHLFSTGRCGSTLASRIFATLDGVWSLSEPDIFSVLANVAELRGTKELRDLLRASLYFTYKPLTYDPEAVCILKYRAEAMYVAEELVAANPDAISIFLYRDILGWMKSVYRFAQKQGEDMRPGPKGKYAFLWGFLGGATDWRDIGSFVDPDSDGITMQHFSATLWCHRMEHYKSALAHGAELLPLSYNQLNNDRAASVLKMLGALGVASEDNVARAMKAYEKDAHTGTAGANANVANEMPDEAVAYVQDLMANHPRVRAAMVQE